MNPPANKTIIKNLDTTCTIIHGDSRLELKDFEEQADLIVTSPPYADARHKHYDSVHPDKYVDWFMTFHEPFFKTLKPTGSFILNIKDKVVDGVRHRYVWHLIDALSDRGWFAIDDYIGHPAVFPVDLPLFFIKLLCPEDGFVVDPFAGSGTTGVAAFSIGRQCLLIDNNAQYYQEAVKRLGTFGTVQSNGYHISGDLKIKD